MLGHRTLNAEDYFAILKRRWWIILVPALLMPVMAVILTYFLTPKYDSISQILIDQQKVSSEVVKPLDLGDLQSKLGVFTAQIESRSSLEPIVTKYNLYANQHLSMEDRVALVRKNLLIAPIQSQIDKANGLPGFKVVFTADDPHTAQQVCADITGLYTQNNLLNRQNMTAGTKEFLQTALNEETRKLDDMDQKLAEFKSQHLGALPGDESGTADILSSLSSRLDATGQEIMQLQQRKDVLNLALQEQKRADTPAAITTKTTSADEDQLEKLQATLSDLKSKYSEDYPDVKTTERLIAEQKAKIAKDAAAPQVSAPVAPRADSPQIEQLQAQIRIIDQDIAQRQKEQQSLQAQMGSAQGRLQSSPVVEQQYQELTRDYQTEQATYNKLLQEMDQSGMATELENRQEGENFTVLDAASLPIDPTFPKQSMFAFGGIIAGLGLGLSIVALLEYRDTALRTERDIWAFTQLPTLAVLAYSAEIAQNKATNPGFLKRIFQRKGPEEQLAG